MGISQAAAPIMYSRAGTLTAWPWASSHKRMACGSARGSAVGAAVAAAALGLTAGFGCVRVGGLPAAAGLLRRKQRHQAQKWQDRGQRGQQRRAQQGAV